MMSKSVEELEREVARLSKEVVKGNNIIQVMQAKIGTIEGTNAILQVERAELDGFVKTLYAELESVRGSEAGEGNDEEVGE